MPAITAPDSLLWKSQGSPARMFHQDSRGVLVVPVLVLGAQRRSVITVIRVLIDRALLVTFVLSRQQSRLG